MELDLPYGPWTKIVSAEWGRYPIVLYQNPDKIMMLVLFEKTKDKVTGMVLILKKIFVVEGDIAKFMQAQKREVTVIEKFSKDYNNRYLLVGATPAYSTYSQDELIESVKKQYLELEAMNKLVTDMSKGYGFKVRGLEEATDAEAQTLLGDPLTLFAYSAPAGSPASLEASVRLIKAKIGINSEGEDVEVKLDSFNSVSIVGETREKRLHVMHVLCESVLQNSVSTLIFDSTGALTGLAFPNDDPSRYTAFHMPGMAAGFPFKAFELGENLYIDLSKSDSDLFLRTFGLEKTEFASIVRSIHEKNRLGISTLGDLINELSKQSESKDVLLFNIKRAIRSLEVLQKVYPSLFAKNIAGELTQPWQDVTGRVYHLKLSKYPPEVQRLLIDSVLHGLVSPPTASLQLLVAFEQNAQAVTDEVLYLINKFRKQGVGFVIQADHELDIEKVGENALAIEAIGDEVVAKEVGEKQVRLTIRPAYSKCTEFDTPRQASLPETAAQARRAPLETVGVPADQAKASAVPPAAGNAAKPVQKKHWF